MGSKGQVVSGGLLALLLTVGLASGAAGDKGRLVFPRQTRRGLEARLVQIALTQRQSGQTAALSVARAEGLGTAQNRVRVIVEAQDGRVPDAEDAVTRAGGSVVATADGLIEALVPPAALETLATSTGVDRVRPPAHMQLEAVDEGVAATNANVWQVAGNDGTGVKVAVIDGGFTGYTTALSGATYTVDDRCGGQFASATEHGTAVAELVHQMAPGAQLLLICIDTEVDLALAEQDAVNAGAQIINHSVGWFNTSRGDGTGAAGSPDAIAADARAHGILWVNAIGNHAQEHWSGTFAPSATDPDVHSFAGSDFTNTVTIASGDTGCAFLRWDAWPKTTEDFDLYLLNSAGTAVVDGSTNDQAAGPLPPTEEFCYTNSGATAQFGLAIVRFSASTTPRFDLFFTGASDLEYRTAPGSLVEPASSPATVAVGADCYQNGAVEFYSSQGPTIDLRIKPDLLAPDSVSTTTYGPAGSCAAAGFPGTSAAAPQVAGAAALLLQRTSSLTPNGLRAALLESTQAHTGIAPNSQTGVGPLWLASNPSGGRLAFSTFFASDIQVAGSDGSGAATVLPGNYAHPSWSPDGSQFAVTQNISGTTGVTVANANGSNPTVIYNAGGTIAYHAAWSPDGTTIAFDTGGSVDVVPAGGAVSPTTLAATGTSPAWSPDSAKIAYVASGEIWVMNATDGSSKMPLTAGASLTGVSVDVGSPAWSPDGTKIVYANSGAIWEMDAAGTNQHQLVAGSGLWDPIWSPDGKTIAFLDGSDRLHEALADGSDDTALAPTGIASPSFTSAHPGAAIALSSSPIISGTVRVGQPLEAGAGAWAGAEPFSFTYAWQRCNSGGSSCVPIGATNDWYTPVVADVGSTLKAVVTGTSQLVGVGSFSATTAATAVVAVAKPYSETLPTINGTRAVGSTLVAGLSIGNWTGTPSLSLQWRRCDTDGGGCVNIGGATGSGYTLTSADQGKTIRVALTGTNASGSNTITSLATVAIGAAAGGGTGGGGGGGGGGGSSSFTVSVSPASQTVASGSSAVWTISVRNSGGAYLYAVGVRTTAGNCGIPSSFADTASLMPPLVTISYGCSQAGVTASLTNTVTATATTGPGDVLTQTATATVTVQGAPTPPAPTPPPPVTPPSTKPTLETINGTAKADHLTGTNGRDRINGRGGNDVIRALGGNDIVDGGTGNDTIFGGAGNDNLTGGAGKDKIYGGTGRDTIHARDHTKDVVDCGSGKDTVYADGADAVGRNCEVVHRFGAAV